MIDPTGMAPLSLWGPPDWHDADRRADLVELARSAEALGFGSLWIGGGFLDSIPGTYRDLLAATKTIFIASGVLSIWHTALPDMRSYLDGLPQEARQRFLWGLGCSHAPFVEAAGLAYRAPLRAMRDYLDDLDGRPELPDRTHRVLAALGPQMLALAAERSLGAHPYLVTPAHTGIARDILGTNSLLVPEQAVVLEEDPAVARMVGRRYLARYLTLPNYTNNLLRLGFTTTDLEHDGSDALVDQLVAWGSIDAITTRIREHLIAGANSVAARILPRHQAALPLVELSSLAAVIPDLSS